MKKSFVPKISTSPIEKVDRMETPEIFPPRIEMCSYDFIDQLSELIDNLNPKSQDDIIVKLALKEWVKEEEKRHLSQLFMSLE